MVKSRMNAEILIVDDERAVRQAIAAILGDEGYSVRHAAESQAAIAEIEARAPGVVLLGHLAGGLQARRPGGARSDQADPPGGAGHRDQRPRHDRDRGQGDQEGRLRLSREAVQRRPAAAADRAGARSHQAQARERRAQAEARRRPRADRQVERDPAGAQRDLAGGADRQPGADHRRPRASARRSWRG